jgi:hypothetical protein
MHRFVPHDKLNNWILLYCSVAFRNVQVSDTTGGASSPAAGCIQKTF